MRRNIFLFALLFLSAVLLTGCRKSVSFAQLKKNEREAIEKYLNDEKIQVISEKEFYAQDSTTDCSKNQWVLFNNTGVYMQIQRKGTGIRIGSGRTRRVLCRYLECNLLNRDTISSNFYASSVVEVMRVTNTADTYNGTFISGYMKTTYNSDVVPTGWMVPMPFIRLSRDDSQIAKVRLIVPYSAGTSQALTSVYPCMYEITYQLGQ